MASTTPKLNCEMDVDTGEGQEGERGNWDELPQEVLNMIFNHLPVADLLSCGVTSKNWKKASRDVLKRSRECYAYIRDFPQDLRDLNDMIASKDFTQMFNGLNIKVKPAERNGSAVRKPEFSRSFAGNILKSKATRRKLEKAKRKLQAVLSGQWKYLNLDMGWRWKEVLSIDDALLLRELISATSESLLKLVVGQDLDCDFMSCCGNEFSKLKVLQIQDKVISRECLKKFVLECAPNLEEITGAMQPVKIDSPWNSFMLSRMKSIMTAPNRNLESEVMEGIRSVSGVRRLDLKLYHLSTLDDRRVLFSMVRRSLNTLEELRMRTLEFYKLFETSRELKFPNLRRLSLATHRNMPKEHQILALKLLNLPKLCPNLEHVELSEDQHADAESYVAEEWNPFEGPHRVDHSELPVQIEYECRDDWKDLGSEPLEFFIQIYPNTKKVKLLKCSPGHDSNINTMFSDLHSLEYLEINVTFRWGHIYDLGVAIAAILCGINYEEAKFLCSGSPGTHAKLNPYIVPIRSSLFNAKNLKEVKITGERNYPEGFVDYLYSRAVVIHSWAIQITENLPVRHVRNLIVTFEGSEGSYEKLNYLRALTTLLGAQVQEN